MIYSLIIARELLVFFTMFFKTQYIVQTMHLTMLIALPSAIYVFKGDG